VLNVLARPYDAREPVVGLDERPVALRQASRLGRPMTVGRLAREDYEYVRTGTANVYCIVEPKAGRHVTHATRDRKAPHFVRALHRIARRYRTSKTIHLIMDNLNLHSRVAVMNTLGPTRGAALWARFTPHYTPKHGSWLNPAEIEASLWSRECHGRDRVDTFEALARSHARLECPCGPRETENYLAFYDRQSTVRLSLQHEKHYVAVEALVSCMAYLRRRC